MTRDEAYRMAKIFRLPGNKVDVTIMEKDGSYEVVSHYAVDEFSEAGWKPAEPFERSNQR